MSDRPTAHEVLQDHLVDAWECIQRPLDREGADLVDRLRAAAGCVPGQPLVILDPSGDLTTEAPICGAEHPNALGACTLIAGHSGWHRREQSKLIASWKPARISGAEEAPNG